MEGHAIGHQAQLLGEDQQVQGHVRVAAELARQRPVGRGGAFGEDAHIDLGAGGGLGDVAQVGFGVGGEQAHALLVEVADVPGFLDGVAVADALRADTGLHHLVQLVDGGDVEVRPLVTQQLGDLGGRVGLHCVVDLGEGEAAHQLIVGIGDGLLVDHHERGFLLIGKRLHALEGFGREVVFDLDRHARDSIWQNKRKLLGVARSLDNRPERLISFPTLVRLLPKACRRGSSVGYDLKPLVVST
ncbi:hypothetical protein D3C85_1182780 [compost metagenome]